VTKVSIPTGVVVPVQLFTEATRARRHRVPEVMTYKDLVTFFTLSERDPESVPRYSASPNRLGYALQRIDVFCSIATGTPPTARIVPILAGIPTATAGELAYPV
jgi:hypothetical protein